MFGCATPINYYTVASTPRKVMAFYYTWYGTPEVSGRWHHWPEGGHNPDNRDSEDYRDIGATNHPDPDVYDSNNPVVIQQHLTLCAEMGIDALISTWWGVGDYHDKALQVVLREANKTDIQITVYYETVRSSHSVESAVEDLVYILENYGDEPSFLKVNGTPVIFVYGRAMGQLGADDWREVLQQVKTQHDALFIADTGSKELIEIFDGGHTYNPVGLVARGDNMAEHYTRLVKTCRDAGKIACATIIPGYDDSNIGRARAIVAERRDGQLYRELWNLAMQSQPDWILITSFNEWHEGSEVEPSKQHGRSYSGLTREYSEKFKGN